MYPFPCHNKVLSTVSVLRTVLCLFSVCCVHCSLLALPHSHRQSGNEAFVRTLTDSARAVREMAIERMERGEQQHLDEQLEEAMESFEEAIEVFEALGDHSNQAHTMLNMAQIHQKNGAFESAVSLLIDCQEYFLAHGEDSASAVVLEQIALVHWWQGRSMDALEGFRKSLKQKMERGDTLGAAISRLRIGIVHAQLGQYDSAEAQFMASITNLKGYDDPKVLAVVKRNLGNVYSATGREAEARSSYLESISLSQLSADHLGLSETYNNLGDSYYNSDNYEKALRYFTLSANISDSIGARNVQAIAVENQALTYEMLGDFEGAFNAMWKADSLRQDINEEKYSREVAQLQEQFESEKKDFQIADLEKENQLKALALEQEQNSRLIWSLGTLLLVVALLFTVFSVIQHRRKNGQLALKNNEIEQQRVELAATNNELQESTETKERLFAIIAHNLKGPLSALEGVSGIMEHYLKKGQTDKLKTIVTEIDNTAFQTNSLVANLLNWSRAKSRNIPYRPQPLELRGALCQCIDFVQVQARLKEVKVSLSPSASITVFADLNFLKTLMTNLLHNAIKFTPRGGHVDIKAFESEGRIQIAVCDSGIGIATERMAELFSASASKSTYGTDGEHGTGLGLYVCQEFARIEGGEFHVESTLGKGSTFSFSLAKGEALSTPLTSTPKKVTPWNA